MKCEQEEKCATCDKKMERLYETAVTCSCHKYGYGAHEDLIWCSEDCMWDFHPY